MITNNDGTALKSVAGSDKQREHQSVLQAPSITATDTLPPYTPTVSLESSNDETSSTSAQYPQGSIPNLKPVNLLSLSREYSSVKSHFVLDPTLSIPAVVLPPLTEGETELDRKNLSLTSTTSSVSAEIWIVSGNLGRAAGSTGKKRASIQAKSEFGPVAVRIHKADTPFIVVAKSTKGSVSVCIPRSFCGHVRVSTQHGSLKFSSALTSNVTLFSDIGKKRHGFIGDLAGSGWGESDGSEWYGDELVIESTWGSVSISYVDEPPKVGILSRMRSAFS